MNKVSCLLGLMLIPLFTLQAQTTKQEVLSNIATAGGNYYSYPVPTKALTPAPEGYAPFYISHYGRHGSRYIIGEHDYTFSIAKLDSAEQLNELTSLGKDVLGRLRRIYDNAKNRDGELTRAGALQHQGIAHRMYQNFPELLSQPLQIDARSSTSIRCILSMSNFCQELRSLNPKLQIAMDASRHDMWYLVNDGNTKYPTNPAQEKMEKKMDTFTAKMFHTDRLMSTLFTNKDFMNNQKERQDLMDALYNIAEDMQCLPELNISLMDLFTEDELFDIWQTYNADWCLWDGLMPSSSPTYIAHYALMKNILDTADSIIQTGGSGATLRFGHDAVVLPLSYILKLNQSRNASDDLDNLYKQFSNFKVIPMAANIQIIFYRKTGSDDILVKFLLNEIESDIPIQTDCAPYYHWKDVETFYRNELSKEIHYN